VGLTDFRPLLQVSFNGIPLSAFVFSTISSVRVTDLAGFVSDTAELKFANVSPLSRFIMPSPGAEVDIAMGYLFGFRRMGVFVADEIEESEPPRMITAVCRAKAQGITPGGMGPIHQQRSRSWDAGLPLGAIVASVAEENGLRPAVTERAGAIVPGHIDQVDESDISMLTRIALRYDLIAKPAGGRLFLGRRADAITASGKAMPTTLLYRARVSSWRMRRILGEQVGTVVASYRDLEQGRDVEVEVGEGEPVRRLRQRYRSEDEARAVADAESRRAGRAVETLEVSMPGNPSVVAESKLIVIDFSAAAAGEWVVESATHEISDNGYSTSVKAKRPE
jgi:phage protein D